MRVAVGAARRTGGLAGDEARQAHARPRHGQFRGAVLFQLPPKRPVKQRRRTAQRGNAAFGVPDSVLCRRDESGGGRRVGRGPPRVLRAGYGASPRPSERHRNARRGDGNPVRGSRHRVRSADFRRAVRLSAYPVRQRFRAVLL